MTTTTTRLTEGTFSVTDAHIEPRGAVDHFILYVQIDNTANSVLRCNLMSPTEGLEPTSADFKGKNVTLSTTDDSGAQLRFTQTWGQWVSCLFTWTTDWARGLAVDARLETRDWHLITTRRSAEQGQAARLAAGAYGVFGGAAAADFVMVEGE